jgi:hypothetical protein
MKIYVSKQGKPLFHGGNIFSWPTVCFVYCLDRNYVPFCETKNCRRYYLSAVFFPAFQGGKIFPPGAQENAENFTPYKCATNINNKK